ncbi:MAG: translin [Actinomycetota bacterium]|nr:translin [Actinomycetota bacterium]
MADRPRGEELFQLIEPVRAELDAAHRAREAGLAACRRTIRACGRAIRAIHRLQPDDAAALTDEARVALREAQSALKDHPAIFFAGFLHDAEKEYAEAVLCAAMVDGLPLPSCADVGVEAPAWLNGMAEAASELRRHLLDRMREGNLDRAEQLMREMEDVYDALVTIDFPDAMVGGLRRTVDSLRAVLERTRSDVTMTLIQTGLRTALEERGGDGR